MKRNINIIPSDRDVATMDPEDIPPVTDGRALTTDRDRRHLARAKDVDDNEYYQAVSRIRRRIRENMDEDVTLLHENHPDLLEELQETVCEVTAHDEPIEEAIDHVTEALTDLNRVRSQRAVKRAFDEQDQSDDRIDEKLDDAWKTAENASLEAALEHIDVARRLVADEVDNSTVYSDQNEG